MKSVVMDGSSACVLAPWAGKQGFLGSLGVRFMVDGTESGGGFSLVEHTLSPRALAAPLHRHIHEDEYSYVLEGQLGALLGEEMVTGGPGSLIVKPRGQWHTFWNAGDRPARILEIISPAGFEQFFAKVVELGGMMNADPRIMGELSARYGMETDLSSVPSLVERFGLKFPGEPVPATGQA